MADTINADNMLAMLQAAIATIRENEEMLSNLDAATGDGDHGAAMAMAVGAADKAITEWDKASIKSLLHGVGWGMMCIDGGSTGPLWGSLFVGMSKGAGEADTLDSAALATAFETGLEKLQKQSKAVVGDKTMMDALIPAVGAIRTAADASASVNDAMAAAATAAADGAAATTDMVAKFGRARNLGDRVLGHVDPGATSMSLLFKAFSEAL
ncbi:MAG: dihydroxyacetone kinase subunit L [Phycisphaerales bacterium]|jgi:phosphoenolpyruvate---glycerone phosphotransferase subunit DhaL|nr:dihydroxyacetone kinase subunit L [Phycisphaerales bacterium]